MRAARYTIRQADGVTVTGPIQGCGGVLGEGALMRIGLVIERANDGRDIGIFEPKPGHARMYPDYSAEGNGTPVDVDLRGAQVLV